MKTTVKIFTAVILLLSTQYSVLAQQSITIDQCYTWAESNYPLTKQRELIQQTKEYSIENISKGIYPQFIVSGQATYQSEVTRISIPIALPPGTEFPTVPKDQYRMAGEVSQSLLDFSMNKTQRELKENEAMMQQQNITVELYKLKERINQIFFGALMIDEQLKQSGLLKKDIQSAIDQTQSAIDNGTAFHSSLNKLKAENMKVQQRDIELKAAKDAYLSMLALFTGKDISPATTLVRPQPPIILDTILRPELNMYMLQKRGYELQEKMMGVKNLPKLNVFFQGGLGSPSPLNVLSKVFKPYYITGARINWSLGGMYSMKKEKLITQNDRQSVDVLQNIFLFNTKLAVKQQDADIQKYMDLVQTDDAIIQLRESVKKTSLVQLENGVITTNDYLKDVNEADQAMQNKILHDLQLLMIQYAKKTTTGN